MLKNIIISVMAAVIAVDKLSCTISMTDREQAGLWIGITAILIIFCIFLEIQAEEWRKRRVRVRQIQQILRQMSGEEGKQWTKIKRKTMRHIWRAWMT